MRRLHRLQEAEAVEVKKSEMLMGIDGLLLRKRRQALQMLIPGLGRVRMVVQVIMAVRGNQRDGTGLDPVLQG